MMTNSDPLPPDSPVSPPSTGAPPVPVRDPRWRPSPTKWLVAVILLIGIVVPLLVSTYDSVEPRVFGFPFFYWYQLLWVFITAGLCGLSYWLLRRERAAYDRQHTTRREGAR